jgi:hypothetical protein
MSFTSEVGIQHSNHFAARFSNVDPAAGYGQIDN